MSAMKVPFNDFIQNMSQAPSKCLSEPKSRDKFDYLKNPSKDFNFFYGSYKFLAILEQIQYCKITVRRIKVKSVHN